MLADRAAILRPPRHEIGPAVEAIEKHFVLRAEQIDEKAIERGLRGDDLFADHAAARVERDPEAHRHAIGVELRDLLRLAVFVDDEVLALEAADEPSVAIGDRDADVDEIDARLERESLAGRALLASRRSRQERNRADDEDRNSAEPGERVHDPSIGC